MKITSSVLLCLIYMGIKNQGFKGNLLKKQSWLLSERTAYKKQRSTSNQPCKLFTEVLGSLGSWTQRNSLQRVFASTSVRS